MSATWHAGAVARRAAFILGGLPLATPAAADICPSYLQPPQVTFTIDPGKLVYIHQANRRELHDLRRQYGKVVTLDTEVVGLTVTDLKQWLQIEVETRPVGQGRSCAYLRKVEATIGYENIRVYVARDYRPGSCPDGAILAHENRHVTVHRTTLQRFGPNLRQALEGTARKQGPLVVGPIGDAIAVFQERLRQALDPLFTQMNHEMDRANAVIDSPASYAGDHSRCKDW